jgi:hypothetical protein
MRCDFKFPCRYLQRREVINSTSLSGGLCEANLMLMLQMHHDMLGNPLQHLSHSPPMKVVGWSHTILDGDEVQVSCPNQILKQAAGRGTLESP